MRGNLLFLLGVSRLAGRGDPAEVALQSVFSCLSGGRGDAEDEPIGVRKLVDIVMAMGV